MKKLFQLLLIGIIVLISIIFYVNYLKNDDQKKANELKKEQNTDLKSKNNLIKNLKYNVKLDNNSEYNIKSELSELNYNGDIEIVTMQTVIAQFIDENGNVLIITSDNAIYNNSNYNTIFENNVVINYLDHAIKSDKLNLNFTDNFVTIYDNVVYEGSQGTMTTDNIVIDLISKDITIYMNNKIKKVQVKLNK